jgi:hypothetical protein
VESLILKKEKTQAISQLLHVLSQAVRQTRMETRFQAKTLIL